MMELTWPQLAFFVVHEGNRVLMSFIFDPQGDLPLGPHPELNYAD